MKANKKLITDKAIDLFAEYGVKEVSLERLAKEIGISRQGVKHHFKNGKDGIIESILCIFDALIQNNTPQEKEWMNSDIDAKIILSKLFFSFNEFNIAQCRNINRIIFIDQHYVKKLRDYVKKSLYFNREAALNSCFKAIIEQKKVKPFCTEVFARFLNRAFISYAMEDSYNYPFENNLPPESLEQFRSDCMIIVEKILNGNLSED